MDIRKESLQKHSDRNGKNLTKISVSSIIYIEI